MTITSREFPRPSQPGGVATESAAKSGALKDIADRLLALTPESERALHEATQVIPDGFSRARFFWPTPIYLERGRGCRVWDVDGREYLDCLLGFGVMLLGHGDPGIVQAVREQLGKGVQFGTAVPAERELAALLTAHVPGAEQVVFLNSGTEATLAAIRLAIAATGCHRIAKFEGGWHGWHDRVLHSTSRSPGEVSRPATTTDSLGVPGSAARDVLTLPFNDPAAFDLIEEQQADLACVVLEGVQGAAGCIVAEREWAQRLQETCHSCQVLLVVDEVITGFRLGPQGAAGLLGIEGDLTTLGKAIGGGFPIGAVVGRADLMQLTVPNRSGSRVLIGGTFAGHPLTLAAGISQVRRAVSPEVYEPLALVGESARSALSAAVAAAGIEAAVTGTGPLWGFHFRTKAPPRSVRESAGVHLPEAFALAGLLGRHGVLMEAPIHQGFLSTEHGAAEIEQLAESHLLAFDDLERAELL